MSASAPRLAVDEIRLYERPVTLRMPFRFGVVSMTAAPQAFARARVALADGRGAWGAAAEVMAPKWFDKDPALSNADNFDQLRASLAIARALYLDTDDATAFGLTASCYVRQVEACAARGLNRLIAGYGPALIAFMNERIKSGTFASAMKNEMTLATATRMKMTEVNIALRWAISSNL